MINRYLLFLIVLLTSPHYSTVVIVPFTCSLALQNTYNEFSDNDNLTLRPRLYIILCAVLLDPESWTLDMGRCLAGQSTLSFDLYSLFLFCIASSTCLLISSLCSLACVRLPAGFATLVCLKYIAFSLALLTAVVASLC